MSAIGLPIEKSAAKATVDAVSDGDTIHFVGGTDNWVRLIGVNAPNNDEKHELGRRATRLVTGLALGKSVRYTLGPQRREEREGGTGRLQAYVWLPDGRSLNELLLLEGLGQRQTNQHELQAFAPILERDQEAARLTGRGLWATCHV